MVFAVLGLVGIALFIHRKTKMDFLYCPMLSACLLVTISTLAGIVGILEPCRLVCVVAGCILLCYSLLMKRDFRFIPSALLLVAFLLYALWRLDGCVASLYDDASHWASMARFLLLNQELPTKQAELITFTSYPPGAAMFIYYMCGGRFLAEDLMYTAQLLFVLVGVMPLFAPVQGKSSVTHKLIALLITACLLISNVSMQQLSVDTLLATLTLGGIVLQMRSNTSAMTKTISTVIVGATLITIKASGIFFAVVLYGYYWWTLRRTSNTIRLGNLVPLLVFTAIYLIWQNYVSSNFGTVSKHAVDFSSYMHSFVEKWNSGTIWKCIKATIKALINPYELYNHALVLLLLGTGCVYWCTHDNNLKIQAKHFLFQLVALWMLWQICVFMFMYVFSASDEESVYLSGHVRYFLTMIQLMAGLYGAFLQENLTERFSYRHFGAVTVVICLLLPFANSISSLVVPSPPTWMRIALDRHVQNSNFDDKQGVVLYTDEYTWISDYGEYIGRYVLAEADGSVPRITCVANRNYREVLPELMKEYEYLLFMLDDTEAYEYAEQLIGERAIALP